MRGLRIHPPVKLTLLIKKSGKPKCVHESGSVTRPSCPFCHQLGRQVPDVTIRSHARDPQPELNNMRPSAINTERDTEHIGLRVVGE